MGQRIFLVDVEATNKTPYSGVMTEFGVVDFTTRCWFHGHLWDFHPDPKVPARPVAERENPGFTATVPSNGEITFNGERHDIDLPLPDRSVRVYAALMSWLMWFGVGGDGSERAVFVSDNPGFDFMWMADGFDRAGLANPFGHTGRRIGDLAAGLTGNWKNTSGWKKHRKTPHDHNPVNDALGNAEALTTILERHRQRV
jgi:hypothetical protein